MISSRKTLLLAAVLGATMFAPLVWQAYWPARWPLDAADHAVGRDFINLWVGGRLLWEGSWQTLFDVEAYQQALHRLFDPRLAPHVWSYPPTSFLMAAPLALMPYGTALAVWTLAGLVAFAATARIGLEAGAAQRASVIALLAPAAIVNVICGQNGFLTAALLAGGVLNLDRRPLLAGVLIGLLSYKPHFGIVIAPVLLALGAWRVIAVAAATALLITGVSILLYGFAPWLAFLHQTVPMQAQLLKGFTGFFTTMLISPYASLRDLGVPHAAAMGLQVLVTIAVVVACAVAVRRTRDADTRLLLVASATFLATPYALTYDLPLIGLVLARQLARGSAVGWAPLQALLNGAAWAAPMTSPVFVMLGIPLTPLFTAGLFAFNASALLSSFFSKAHASAPHVPQTAVRE